MKRILLTSALILAAAAGTASATNLGLELSVSQRQIVRSYLPNANLDNLTSLQVGAIGIAITDRDSDIGSSFDFATRVQKILNWE